MREFFGVELSVLPSDNCYFQSVKVFCCFLVFTTKSCDFWPCLVLYAMYFYACYVNIATCIFIKLYISHELLPVSNPS